MSQQNFFLGLQDVPPMNASMSRFFQSAPSLLLCCRNVKSPIISCISFEIFYLANHAKLHNFIFALSCCTWHKDTPFSIELPREGGDCTKVEMALPMPIAPELVLGVREMLMRLTIIYGVISKRKRLDILEQTRLALN